MTIAEAMGALAVAGGALWLGEDGRTNVDTPEEAAEPAAVLRAIRETVTAALCDVSAFAAARCCRSPRVWCEADLLHDAYRARGGRLDRGTFLAALCPDGGGRVGTAGLVACVGLVADWQREDGGALRHLGRGGRHG